MIYIYIYIWYITRRIHIPEILRSLRFRFWRMDDLGISHPNKCNGYGWAHVLHLNVGIGQGAFHFHWCRSILRICRCLMFFSAVLAFYRKIISDILSGILSGIRVQACPTASGSHSSAERRREWWQRVKEGRKGRKGKEREGKGKEGKGRKGKEGKERKGRKEALHLC